MQTKNEWIEKAKNGEKNLSRANLIGANLIGATMQIGNVYRVIQ